MTSTWADILDSLACQIDLQERALAGGHATPVDLEIDPPTTRVEGVDRLRAIELFERCEGILTAAAARAVGSRSLPTSPYGQAP